MISPEISKIFYGTLAFVAAFVFGLGYRYIVRKFAKNTTRGVVKNIGKHDQTLRLLIGIFLLLWAIFTSWSPLLLFFSGFTFFEAIFSWCGFYAALGKNTCPL